MSKTRALLKALVFITPIVVATALFSAFESGFPEIPTPLPLWVHITASVIILAGIGGLILWAISGGFPPQSNRAEYRNSRE